MARDLIVNGTNYASRLGANKLGTFWSAVQPPYPVAVQELISNTGFEVDTTGWSSVGGYAIARVTSQFHSGVASLEMNNAFSGSSVGCAKYAATLTNGGKYRFSFWFRNTSGNTNVTVIPDNGATITFTATSSWQFATFVFTSSLTNGGILIYSSGAAVFQIDDISLTYLDNISAYTLDYNWAERLAETSGRVRGLSGIGTIPVNGTLAVLFPISYFQHVPIVDISHQRRTFLKSTIVDYGIGQQAQYYNGLFVINNPYGVEFTSKLPDTETQSNQWTLDFQPTVPWFQLYELGTLGFKVTNITAFQRNIYVKDEPIYWHAFGV